MFVTHSKTSYQVRWTSPAGQEIEVIQIHLAVGVFRAALSAIPAGYRGAAPSKGTDRRRSITNRFDFI